MGRRYGGDPNEGDHAKYSQFLQELACMPKPDLYNCTGKDIERHCARYREICQEFDMAETVPSFSYSIRVTPVRFKNMIEGKGKPVPRDVREQLEWMGMELEASLADGTLAGRSNVVGGIFLLKNYYGYKDTSEQVVVHKQSERLTADELKALADNLPDVIDGDYTEIPPSSQIGVADEDPS